MIPHHICDCDPRLLRETEQGRYVEPKETPEQLRSRIDDAVLHCLQSKARAIEAAELYVRNQQHQ